MPSFWIKRGTVTKGKPEVTDFIAFNSDGDQILPLVVAAEKASEHPLAQAIVDYGTDKNIAEKTTNDFEAIPGHGIQANIGRMILIGTRKLMKDRQIPFEVYEENMSAFEKEVKTVMLIAVVSELKGMVAVADTLKESSKAAIRELISLGLDVYMITGDNECTAKAIAKQAGIDHVFAEVLPEHKAEKAKELQKQKKFAMIGDGISDVPALAAADIVMAIGAGTDVAIEAADITLVGGELEHIPKAIALSRYTMKNIRQNLFWALFYNSIGGPVAALGLLAPWIAGAAMAFSSVSAVTNALRLKRVKL